MISSGAGVMKERQEIFKRLDEDLQQLVTKARLPGLVVTLTDRENILSLFTYGYANLDAKLPVSPETVFEIGSIGKTFTALLLLQQVEAGKLDLNEPVSRYLPWFQVQSEFFPITVHHLLTHTGGITTGTDLAPHGTFEVFALQKQHTSVPPGTFYHYSNVGYKTLGYLVEALTGKPYGKVLQEGILNPLRMLDTHALITLETRRKMALGYRPFYDDRPVHAGHLLTPAEWHEYGGADGSLATTPGDLAVFLRMLLNRGKSSDGRIITEESFHLMSEGYINIPKSGGVGFDGGQYGYGLMIQEFDGHTCIGHLGATPGYHAAIFGDLEDGLGVTLQTNGWGDLQSIGLHALRALRSTLCGGNPPEVPQVSHLTRVDSPSDYIGIYRTEVQSFTVEATENQVMMIAPDGERVALERRGKDQFYVDHPDFSLHLLHFSRNGDHRVTEASFGPEWFTNQKHQGPRKYKYPEEWERLIGHYRSHNPWFSNFRIYIRRGMLWLGEPNGTEHQLVHLENDLFRVGADGRSPERISFDSFVDGHALRANFSGCDYYRTFTP